MLFLKIGLPILVVVLPCYSKSHALHSKLVKRASENDSKSVPRKYHSNHPPLEEYVPISIPVAIVYDGNHDKTKSARTEKAITTYHPRFLGFDTTKTPIEELSSPTTISETTTTKNSVINDKKPYYSKTQITKELHIPVVVVYDPVTDKNIKRNVMDIETASKTNSRRNRQRQRTLITTVTDNSLTTVPITVTTIEESDPTTVTPATKRRLYVPNRIRSTTTKEKQEATTQAITEKTPTTLISIISTITESATTQKQIDVTLQDVNTDKPTLATVVTPPKRPIVVSRSKATTVKENLETSTIQNDVTNPTTTATKESIRKKPAAVKVSTDKPDVVSTTSVKPRRMKDPVVPIVESQNVVYAQNGAFHYSYEGGDGTKNFENGELKSFEDDVTGEAVSGGFSYKDKDGNSISLTYTADENGYRPLGAHLPTPPPIPPAIARALKYLATKTPEPEEVTESLTKSE